MSDFFDRIVSWQRQHGRHQLPWQNTQDPYRIWLSEIMLQQTQVATVIPYYEKFLATFPTVAALAAAPAEQVMALWAGLGYYTRARNLHACAKQIVTDWGGRFPPTAATIATLPGIGPSTAAAIAAFAYGERSPIMDGNVKRVFTRHFGIDGDPQKRAVEQRLWALAHAQLPTEDGPGIDADMRAYTQGLMDLGATLCKRGSPDCGRCPVKESCVALREARQHELPTPRSRKPLPERETLLLLIECNGAAWVEPRPNEGIWGGLFSLPEAMDTSALRQALLDRQINSAPPMEKLTPLVHTFTHFRLTMHPYRVVLTAGSPAGAGRWLAYSDVPEAGLPAPIKKLLGALPQEPDLFSGA